jgi:CRISPR-associated endonuclease Csn1
LCGLAVVARRRCLRIFLVAKKRGQSLVTLVAASLILGHLSTPSQRSFLGVPAMHAFGLDIGSNSVGSAWIDHETGKITVGLSVFPAGVDESDEKRGDPKNVKRRMSRRTRITLARRALRKRGLRLKLINNGLLPDNEEAFRKLLNDTDPWHLRFKGLTEQLAPCEFGRVLLHLAQRRGAVGFDADVGDKGEVKKAIVGLQLKMLEKLGSPQARIDGTALRKAIDELEKKKKRSDLENSELEKSREKLHHLCHTLLEDRTVTVGRLMAMLQDERRTPVTTPDRRKKKKGPREWREPIRNKAGKFEFHADRAMIRDEFAKLWDAQKKFGGPLAEKLTDELRLALDDESRDGAWRHKGLLFGQRKASWDLGTLGRCVLHPSERCVPHADMYASRYLVVETVNNLKIIERGKVPRHLTPAERTKIKKYLSGPLGEVKSGNQKGQPKRSVTVTDLRELMGWGRNAPFRFNIETDEGKTINTDWFSREIIHGATTADKWTLMDDRAKEGINRAILKHDPDEEKHPAKLKQLVVQDWAGLSDAEADALVAAWKQRPRPDAKRLNMSRRAVRNLLTIMDRKEPWPDPQRLGEMRWLTQIEGRKMIAADNGFLDATTRKPLDEHEKRRYATGARGATAADRHYMRKHLLTRNGEPVYGTDGSLLRALPPAPLITNPVVRKSVHEVRRHCIEQMLRHGCKPDEIYIELAREAKMGKVDADRLLFRNRLRNRIRNDIAQHFNLDSISSTQRRAAVDRVVLCIQQGEVCPLCGNQRVKKSISPSMAAAGSGCEVAHIVPKGCGGHNGLRNIVLAHTECNREMRRQTPRVYWNTTLGGGFDEGIDRVEKIYKDIERPKPSELKTVSGNALWSCYFERRDDLAKTEQFKKNVEDIQGMTARQLAATTYAARQVMAYLADALFDGKGLPERGGDRQIFATDGMWTSRLRKEWGLFFDPHHSRATGLTTEDEHERKEKDRGDHRHHAIDAVAIALCTQQVRNAWDGREKRADEAGINTADEEAMDRYRRVHPLDVPAPFKSREHLREQIRLAVFGDNGTDRAVCHRPVKRKLVGALHEETLFGPVVDAAGNLTDNYTAKKSVYELTPNHLRVPDGWDEVAFKLEQPNLTEGEKRAIRKQLAAMQDPPPGKSGLVRDRALRQTLRTCLREAGLDLGILNLKNNTVTGGFASNDLKKAIESGALKHMSGVAIRSVVLLRTMSDPVIVDRKRPEYNTGRMVPDADPASKRAYVGGNNHHIEIRVMKNKKGNEVWSGNVVTTFEASQKKLDKLRALRLAGVPSPGSLRKLRGTDREKYKSIMRQIDKAYSVVNRTDDDAKGGTFVMNLAEGETVFMKHKHSDEIGYFVVAKLDKPQSIVLVPHWDARSATPRKDPEGIKVPDSKRDQFAITPSDLKSLAPPGQAHAIKVRVSPIGVVTELTLD